MSTAEHCIGGEAQLDGNTPGLSLVKGEVIMPSEQEPQAPKYPDLEFEIDEKAMLGHSAFEWTPEGRVRAVMGALRDSGAEELDPSRRWENPAARERHLSRIKSYYSAKVSVRSNADKYDKEASVEVPRRELVDHADAVGHVLEGLSEENHPVFQVLTHVKDKFDEKMTSGEVMSLSLSVLQLTHWDELRDAYNSQVSLVKEQGPADY